MQKITSFSLGIKIIFQLLLKILKKHNQVVYA
jgi:hypothetical protein